MDEIGIIGFYKEIRDRWLVLVSKVYADLEEPGSLDEAEDVLKQNPKAKEVFDKKMADVYQKIKEALSEAEDDLQLIERQIDQLPRDDRPAIMKLQQHMLTIDQITAGEVDGGVREPKGGIIPWPSNKPIGDGKSCSPFNGFLSK